MYETLNKACVRNRFNTFINPLNAELNPICHLLALLGGATVVVVSRLRVNLRARSHSRDKRPSVRMFQRRPHWTISVKFDAEDFYENLSKKSRFS